jgi:hypothetical protein
MMQVRQLASGSSYEDSPWTRFLTRVGTRVLIRLTVCSILAVGIALMRVHHRSYRPVETAAEEPPVSRVQQQTGFAPNSSPLPPAHYANGGQTTTVVQTPMPIIRRPMLTGGTTERLTLLSANQMAEDARRALDSVPGAGNPTQARNLIERARNDIAILRNSSGRLSPENQSSVLQTAQNLEERAQMLEAQVQAMQESAGQSGPGSTVNQEPQAPTPSPADQGGQQNAPPTGEGQGGETGNVQGGQGNAGGSGLGATPAGGGNGNP